MGKIPVIEIFGSTIQGEGVLIGKKVLFVRTAGCDYSCSWCVGEDTEILMIDGRKVKVQDIVVGDEIRGYDDHQWLMRDTVVDNVVISTRDKTYKVTVDDHEVIATNDHKWWTMAGWVATEDLHHDDSVLLVETGDSRFGDWGMVKSIELIGENTVYDLTCSPYPSFVANGLVAHNCDSKFTWDGSEKSLTKMYTAEELFDECVRVGSKDGVINFSTITISGGNPALIGSEMGKFLDVCHENNIVATIETQGSKIPSWFDKVDYLVVSPKPPSSKQVTNYEILDKLITMHKSRISLKIVVFDDDDYVYAKELYLKYKEKVLVSLQVGNEYVSDGGDIRLALLDKLKWLSEKVIDDTDMLENISVLPQLHTLMWMNERKK